MFSWLANHLTVGGWVALAAFGSFLAGRLTRGLRSEVHTSGGTFQWLTNKFGGRHTLAIFAFFVMGNVFHYLHRLDATYIYYMTVLMGFVLGHSVKEDYFQRRDAQQGPQQIPPIPGQQ